MGGGGYQEKLLDHRLNRNTRGAAGQRRNPPDARAGCPESRLGLPLSDSPASGLQAKKCSSSLDRGSFKNLRPLVTSRSLAPSGECAEIRGGLPVGARSRPTFPRELPGRLLPASPFRRPLGSTVRSPGRRYRTSLGPGFAATGRQLAGARAGYAENGAPARAHSAGRAELSAWRLQYHGQVARSRRTACPAASPRGIRPLSPAGSSCWSVHLASSRPTSPATPPPHSIWLPGIPGKVLPRCKENAAGTEENSGPGPSKQSAPFSRHLSLGTLAPRLLCPTGVSRSQIAPFSSQPTQEPRCRFTRQSEENPILASVSHDQAPDEQWSLR